MKPKVLLLNPPGQRQYVRDNYCSYTSKTGDLWAPMDLLFQSGWLAKEHDLLVIDAIAAQLTPSECLDMAVACRPDAVLCMTGIVSRKEDAEFLGAFHRRWDSKIFLSGDYLLHAGSRPFELNPWLTGYLTDFTSSALSEHLLTGPTFSPGLTLHGKTKSDPITPLKKNGPVRVPRPRHELFDLKNYGMALLPERSMVATMTSFGCAFRCPFCVCSTLPPRERPVEDVAEEITWITTNLGISNLYFHDPLFTGSHKRIASLCSAFSNLPKSINWVCNGYVSILNETAIRELSNGGCHAIMLGIESASEQSRARFGKRFSNKKVQEVVEMCRAAGIETLGYFLLGLPFESEGDMEDTVNFAIRSGFDYASFNLLCPPPGTEMAHHESEDNPQFDHSYDTSLGHPHLTPSQLRMIRRRAYRRFYLSPTIVSRRIRATPPRALLTLCRRGLRMMVQQYLGGNRALD